MIHIKKAAGIFAITFLNIVLNGCKSPDYDNIASAGKTPLIDPDYSAVTIPVNIAPMNFTIMEDGGPFIIRAKSRIGSKLTLKSKDRAVNFPLKSWKKLLAESKGGKIEIVIISKDRGGKLMKYYPFFMNVSKSPVDPYLCYRLLYPGYESWVEMKIVQRSTENFEESSLVENQLLKYDCINCHSFRQNNPDRFLIHERGTLGGTYFADKGKITRINLRTENMKANAVYPSWHPSGKYVAFSSNKTIQSFHMLPSNNIEVSDLYSSLVIYNVGKNEMVACPDNDTIKYMDTFPCWSPEGDYLYFCRTVQKKEYDIRNIKYDLVRMAFDTASGSFGRAELIFNAHEKNKSVSFPSISPDGKSLVFTLHNYGTFSIWHKEADLYLLNLKNMKVDSMTINSNQSESYHSWSSDGKWIVFSSKRGDGLTARPYFAYFGSGDSIGKPFVLPQKDPSLYMRLEKTYNRPELITGKINLRPRDFMNASHKDPVKARWTGE